MLGSDNDATWGEQEVDGRVICIQINEKFKEAGSIIRIKIHTIE